VNVFTYKAYVLTSSVLNDSKALGAFVDAFKRRHAADELLRAQQFFGENEERAARVASLLADEKSREVYRSLVQYRCRRERRFVNPHMQPKKTAYLDRDLIVPGESEVFIDVGAFQGNSSLFFQDVCVSAGRPAPQCVLFEPDPFNYGRLQKNLPKFIKRPVCYQMGLWREGGQLGFRPGALSMSRIESVGQGSIRVDSLDHVLEGLPELPPPTYLKIDVEGADLDVIYGAQGIIQAYRPRIAIAIYHTNEHMIEIPEAIHAMCPSYQLYIRHYSCMEGETILYCI